MIPYEELVEALDRYVAKNGGTPQSARVPSSASSAPSPMASAPAASARPASSASASAASAPAASAPAAAFSAHAPIDYDASAHDDDLPPSASFDEPHDPDLPSLGDDHGDADATHVGAMPGGVAALPPPLAPVHDEDHSNEIDIHDVLDDDEV